MMRRFPIIHHSDGRYMDVCAPRSFSILIVAVALGLAGVAHAQEPVNPAPRPAPLAPPALPAPPTPPSLQAPLAPAAQDISAARATPDDKNPTTAFALSVLGTAAGFGMMVAGSSTDSDAVSLLGLATTVVGPSFGHFYAGEPGRALTHSAVRAGSVGVMLAGAVLLFVECFSLSGETCEPSPGPPLLLATGVVVGAGSAFYSMYDAPRAARRQNTRARRLVLTPAPLAGPDQSSGFGLHLGGQF
jgi:hypothetical protein